MATTQKSTPITIIGRETKMSLAEIIQQLNEGRLKVVKIKHSRNRGYYASMGSEFPKQYEIVSVKPGLVVYRIGRGDKKAWTPGKGVYYKVPALAKPKEGYAIAELRGELVYLYIA
ncbi:MAG: hypothetical protein F7C35_06660 [Desulfurococcales archaeon]|nr:hypothetical protein [Desulfurococcales archaeon]